MPCFLVRPGAQVLLPTAPEGAWVLNRSGRYDPVLGPLPIAEPPGGGGGGGGGGDGPDSDTSDEEAAAAAASRVKGRLKTSPPPTRAGTAARRRPGGGGSGNTGLRPAMVWYDTGDALAPQVWFQPEPHLPRGVALKLRARPYDDAEVLGPCTLLLLPTNAAGVRVRVNHAKEF